MIANPPQKGRTAGVLFIFFTLLIDVVGFGLIIPILPQLVAHFLGGDLSRASTYFGLLTAAFTLMSFIFAPIQGALSDQYGRKPILLLSLAGTALSHLMFAFAPSLAWLFVARIVSGIAGASFSVGGTYIADVSAPEDRGKNFGMIGAAFGLGFIIGPALGGVLAHFGMRVPFYVATVLTTLNLLYGIMFVPESHQLENRRPFSWAKANPVGWAKVLAQYPIVLGFVGSIFFLSLGQQSLQNTWVLFTSYRFHWSPVENGLSLAMVGLVSAVVQGGLIRLILPKLGERRAITVGYFIQAVALILYGVAPFGWMLYVILAFGGLGGIAMPATQGLISRNVGAHEQGIVQGALMSLMSLTGVIAPLFANTLFAKFTGPAAPIDLPGIPFFLGAGCTAIALFNAWRLFRRHPETTTEPAQSPAVTSAS
jgi:DHA1 family tetracycline resistance protein-like MFS transporter